MLVYDEDGYYMGGVIVERLRGTGQPVTLATPADNVSPWAKTTSEHERIRIRLNGLGVGLVLSHELVGFDGHQVVLRCVHSQRMTEVPTASLVMVTQRKPNDGLYREILVGAGGDAGSLPFTLKRIGDCEAPAIIAAAVYAGHRYGRELDATSSETLSFRRETPPTVWN